jgi:heat-inducible transcriptional repressor
MELGRRHAGILNALVEIYVREGSPVSSSRLAGLPGVDLSSATVRSVLADLERGGYLTKPHASSGRVPTHEAYRVYVNHIQRGMRPDERFRGLLRRRLTEEVQDAREVLGAVSSFLSELSENLGVVLRVRSRPVHIRRIRLVGLEGGRLLVVVAFAPEPLQEHVAVLDLRESRAPHVVAGAESYLNERLSGRSVEEARRILQAGLGEIPGEEGLVAREVARHREALLETPERIDLALEGAERLLDHPDLTEDVASLRGFLSMLGHRERLAERLGELIERDPGIHVQIGGEIPWAELRPFSLVAATGRLGRSRGLIGVIGPPRMQYSSVISLVHLVAEELQGLED